MTGHTIWSLWSGRVRTSGGRRVCIDCCERRQRAWNNKATRWELYTVYPL